jgi:hypothetical protein
VPCHSVNRVQARVWWKHLLKACHAPVPLTLIDTQSFQIPKGVLFAVVVVLPAFLPVDGCLGLLAHFQTASLLPGNCTMGYAGEQGWRMHVLLWKVHYDSMQCCLCEPQSTAADWLLEYRGCLVNVSLGCFINALGFDTCWQAGTTTNRTRCCLAACVQDTSPPSCHPASYPLWSRPCRSVSGQL